MRFEQNWLKGNVNMKNNSKSPDYLDIPDVEKLVPFPNFATILLQHAREFPDKVALKFDNKKYTYLELTKFCSNVDISNKDIIISMNNIANDLPILLSCFYQGYKVDLNFNTDTNTRLDELKVSNHELKYFEPPYVKLDDSALVLNSKYHFTQYKVLLAAQAIGKAFNLFREGKSYCLPDISNISDLVFGVLAPLYFSKTIEFTFNSEVNYYQYAWKKSIESNLRDSAAVFTDEFKKGNYFLKQKFDKAMGIGPLIDPLGNLVELLGYELSKKDGEWDISGHGIAHTLV